MIDIVVARLKTHATVKNVVPFGDTNPAPPYVVVTAEPTGQGFTRLRVNVHHNVGQVAFLDQYSRVDAFNLLAYQQLTGSGGRRIELIPQGRGAVVNTNSDKTISQEAVFNCPEMAYT